MKYLFSLLSLAFVLTANDELQRPPGQGKNRPKPPEIAKEIREEMLKKYDTNKDGKLDKEERSKMTPEDRKKMGTPRPPRKPKKD